MQQHHDVTLLGCPQRTDCSLSFAGPALAAIIQGISGRYSTTTSRHLVVCKEQIAHFSLSIIPLPHQAGDEKQMNHHHNGQITMLFADIKTHGLLYRSSHHM
ncbi:hypothetical protein [Candidatus Soleaferrea massiliensis]|uniref:hypothetical protein n=1 Tax=Candidatus Soleaferrea massiliensis TaxID=1470354 RepID=UPI0012E069B7|nr:hypothetical protein [Candidatus Soleaferrea massiliensis]